MPREPDTPPGGGYRPRPARDRQDPPEAPSPPRMGTGGSSAQPADARPSQTERRALWAAVAVAAVRARPDAEPRSVAWWADEVLMQFDRKFVR